ncbi:MAG: NTP transferase domain-containing protein [Candidatus Thalassarchaeaceae archaeon]|nr:NTP transferase domain-containing protein [Candidatus Thalassarchaeaceae archaeon]
MTVVGSQVGCVVLAAGSSKRMGREKALVKIGQETLVGLTVRRLAAYGISPVIVTRSDIEGEIAKAAPSSKVLVNPSPDTGRTGTLQIGIAELDAGMGTGYMLLVVPVDRPGFSDSTLRSLISSKQTSCPEKDGRGGHPLIISADDIGRIRDSPPNVPLRNLVEPERFEVNDPLLHLNVDSPIDLIELSDSLTEL